MISIPSLDTKILYCTRYKSEVIKKYFLDLNNLTSDFTINLKNNTLEFHRKNSLDWKVTLVETGYSSMTGVDWKDYKAYRFYFYDDIWRWLSNINIDELINFILKGRIHSYSSESFG